MVIRTLVVDDEPLARARLAKLAAAEPDVELIGRCANGREAVAAIQNQSPDLVFLDVQMPGLDGFGVLAELRGAPLPAVIFVTASDQFALKAFEVHALDYLLKPVDRERFQAALGRAREQIWRNQSGGLDERLAALLADLRPAKPLARLAIKSNGRVVFIRVEDIDWVAAADNYVELHVGAETHLQRETLTTLAGQLPPRQFIRISRSTIVNVDRIKELQPLFHGEYAVLLRNGTRLTLSRGYRKALDQLVGSNP